MLALSLNIQIYNSKKIINNQKPIHCCSNAWETSSATISNRYWTFPPVFAETFTILQLLNRFWSDFTLFLLTIIPKSALLPTR